MSANFNISEDFAGNDYSDSLLKKSGTAGAGGPPFIDSVTDASARIDDFRMTAAEKKEIESEMLIKVQSQSIERLHKDTLQQSSAALPTDPTFVSVHQADPEDPQLESTYMRNQLDLTESRDELGPKDSSDMSQTIFVWGSNDSGQLGLKCGSFGKLEIPKSFEFQQKIQAVSCGEAHTALVTFSKQLFVMGSNSHGQLGLGDPAQIQRCQVPTLVQSLAHLQVMSVACGAKHTISSANEIIGQRQTNIYSWGDSNQGQTGLADADIVFEPRKIDFGESLVIDKISAGASHSFFINSKTWQVFACGESRQGQLGIGVCHKIVSTPVKVESLSEERVIEVACGDTHTLAINYEGRVLATGSNSSGQLGLGHIQNRFVFEKISELQNILHVGASSHSTAIDCEGRFFRWGQGVKGIYLAPLKIASPRPVFIDQVSTGNDFGLVKNRNGELFTYGVNANGQLGLGDTESRSTLNSLVSLNQKGSVRQMAAGYNFVVCLVDPKPSEPSQFFAAEISMPESAPDRKTTQDGGRKADRTSITEFHDFENREMFTALSEQRLGPGDTGHFDQKSSSRYQTKMLSQQGLPGAKELAQENSDMGTLQTAHQVSHQRAIHHENSHDYQIESHRHEAPMTAIRHQTGHEVPHSETNRNLNVTPPYTHSPFNGDRRQYPKEDTTSRRATSGNRFDLYSSQNNPLSKEPVSENNRMPQDQVFIAQRYQLKSDFARGRSQSSERPPLSGSQERAVQSNEQQSAIAPYSRNMYAGLDNQNVNASLPPLHQPLRRSQSPCGKKVHQQFPSFSANAPNQFRSKSTLNTNASRRGVHQTSGSLENTGQFVSNYAQRMLNQQTHSRQNSNQQHGSVDRSGEYEINPNLRSSASNVLRNQMPTQNQYQQSSGIEEDILEDGGTTDRQLQTLDMANDQNFMATGTNQSRTENTYDQTLCSNLIQRAKNESVTIGTNGYAQINQYQSTTVDERPGNYGRFEQTNGTAANQSHNTGYEWTGVLSGRNDLVQQRPRDPIDQNSQFVPLRDHSGSRGNIPQPGQFQLSKNPTQQAFTPQEEPQQNCKLRSRQESYTQKTSQIITPAAFTPNHHHPTNQQQRHIVEQSAHMESSTLNQPFSTNTIDTFDTQSPEETKRGNGYSNLMPPVHVPSQNTMCCQSITPNMVKSFDNRHQHSVNDYHHQCSHGHGATRNTCHGFDHSAEHFSNQRSQDPHQCSHNISSNRANNISKFGRTRSHTRRINHHHTNVVGTQEVVNQQQQQYSVIDLQNQRQHSMTACPSCNTSSMQQVPVNTQQEPLNSKSYRVGSRNKSQRKHQMDQKMRRKYKKLKQESSRTMMQQSAETEKLKLRIHELQSIMHQKETSDRQQNMQKTDGYQQLVAKFSAEMSVQHEKICKLERTVVARESQLKVVSKDVEQYQQQLGKLDAELKRVEKENSQIKSEATQMVAQIEQQNRAANEQDINLMQLKEQLELKSRQRSDQEASMQHLNKTLEDLTTNFEGAKTHSSQVMAENDRLRSENSQLFENLKVYEKQIENLRSFIDELEANNKELMRFIDRKNIVQANDYKTKVVGLLGQQRCYGDSAILRRPSMEEIDCNKHPDLRLNAGNSMQLIHQQSRSHSPATKTTYTTHAQKAPEHLHLGLQQQTSQDPRSPTENMLLQQSQMSPSGFGSHLVSKNTFADQQFQTQQHCVRRKSQPRRKEQESATGRLHVMSHSPSAVSNSRQRYINIIDKERTEQMQARQSLPEVMSQIHKNRGSFSPTERYMVTKAGQLLDKVTRFQRLTQQDYALIDPRDRLAGKKPTCNHTHMLKSSRSISPADVARHTTSFMSRKSAASRSVSAHNRSTISHTSRRQNHASQSQDSLQVQYQKVTGKAKTSGVTRVTKIEERFPEHRLLQWKLPDIKNLLASSPGKSRYQGMTRSKSPFEGTKTGATNSVVEVSDRMETEPLVKSPSAVIDEAMALENLQFHEESKEQRVHVFPKVTSAMMRQQLFNMNESLATLKRNRVQLEGSMQNYQSDTMNQ